MAFGDQPPTQSGNLQWLIHGIAPNHFFCQYWEREPLVISRADRQYFEQLLSLDEIDRIINDLDVRFPDISLVNASQNIASGEYTFPDGRIRRTKLFQLFADGSTIILRGLHNWLPQLAALCRSLEQTLSAPTQTNIYLTPGNSQGFKPHFDTHDVFILQITNSKHWNLYGSSFPLPLRSQEFDPKQHQCGPVSSQFNLDAGDTAYIPRGIVHSAQSSSAPSLHVTVGLLAYTWADLLAEALAAWSLQNVDCRKGLPIGFASRGFERRSAADLLRRLSLQFVDSLEINSLVQRFSQELALTRRPLLRGQLQQVIGADLLTRDSVVGAATGLICDVQETGEVIRISCFENVITLPLHTAAAVRFAVITAEFAVGDLPGLPDDASKLVLVRRFVREGLLRVIMQ